MKKIIFSLMLLVSTVASAQILSINDAKTKFEAAVNFNGGTPVSNGLTPDGNYYDHEALWHNFIFSPLTKFGVECHHISNSGEGNGQGNHYFRFGLNGMHVFMLPGYQRGIAVTLNAYAEASQYGVHHFDGVASTLFMFSMKPHDSRGVGFIWLLNNPMHMIGLPIFTWKRDWGEHWSINWMTWIGDFSYHFNKKLTLTASYGFSFERNWIKYSDPDNGWEEGTYMATYIPFQPSINMSYQVSKALTLSAGGGVNIPIMNGSIYTESGGEFVKKIFNRKTGFGQVKLTYRF